MRRGRSEGFSGGARHLHAAGGFCCCLGIAVVFCGGLGGGLALALGLGGGVVVLDFGFLVAVACGG